LIYDSPVTGTVEKFTYSELRDLTAKFAGALSSQGVSKGDRVLIYMPMIPKAAIAMLACARLGAVHVCRRRNTQQPIQDMSFRAEPVTWDFGLLCLLNKAKESLCILLRVFIFAWFSVYQGKDRNIVMLRIHLGKV